MTDEIELDGHAIELSSLDKRLFDDPAITKGQVVDYYRRVAPSMLPHVRRRPLTLQRFPEGLSGGGFYQQNRAEYFPRWIGGAETRRRDGSGRATQHIVCKNAAAIVYLANQNTIAFHAWLSHTSSLDRPDRLVFDLDPPGDDFEQVIEAARRTAQLMDDLGFEPHVMTTGSRGLHVVAPLVAESGFDDVRAVGRRMAALLAAEHGDQLTVEQRKDKRAGRLYLDVTRNAFGQTAVAPYSLRALPGAPVATPVEWSELGQAADSARAYSLDNIFRRLGQKDDPWRYMRRKARRGALRRASRRLEEMER